jgi:hypothetical protein
MVELLIVILSGLAAGWAGAGGGKNFRRAYMPVMSMVYGVVVMWNLWLITMMARAGALSLGYGVPDPHDGRPNPDSGSDIGKFWFKLTKNYKLTGILTRGTIGLIEAISILAVPLVSGKWILWVLAAMLIIINNVYWGAIKENEGQFNFFGRKLLWEEVFLHGLDTFIILILVLLCR